MENNVIQRLREMLAESEQMAAHCRGILARIEPTTESGEIEVKPVNGPRISEKWTMAVHIIAALQQFRTLTIKGIAHEIRASGYRGKNRGKVSLASLQMELGRLVRLGRIVRVSPGVYGAKP